MKATKDQGRIDAKGEGPGPLAPPMDMIGSPNQQAYSFEDSGFCA